MATKRMNLSKKKKKHIKLRFIIYSIIIYICFCYSFYYQLKNNKIVSNEEFINLLTSTGNANILNEYKFTSIVNSTMKFIFNIDFTNPITLFNSSILKFNNEDTKSISLEYNDDYSNLEELKTISDYIEDPNPIDQDSPIVYLYNTHQLENYNTNNLDIYGITPNVLMASYLLRENLIKLGIPTIVEDANMSDILDKNNWNYSNSYQASRNLMSNIINKYSTIKYLIDIHRDSVSANYTTISIEGKNYAKILFVIGKEHQGWEENNKFATNLSNQLTMSYPGISRGIMLKEGLNVNGIYNQDISPNCILIEVGGVDNSIEEVYNTMEALSVVLSKYIKGE